MKKRVVAVLVILSLIACNKEKFFDGPDFYQDDFEPYNKLDDLLLPNDQLWSFTQLTKTENGIYVDSMHAHTGAKSLLFEAKKSDDEILSKCSIAKQKMAFWEGETVRLKAFYFLEGTARLDWLFLMDLEEKTAIGAGPGMRLALVDNKLRVEHKFNEKDIIQTAGQEIDFPRNQWVEIVWEIKLSQKKKGEVRLWQNGQLLLEKENRTTLPKDLLYFQQGTKAMYSSCEIGITANSRDNDARLWVDDITFSKKN